MVSQAEKYLWLGLSRTLESVAEDDLPSDTISIDSMTVNLSSQPSYIPSSVDVTMTNKLSQSVTETLVITADEFRVASDSITFSAGASKTVTLDFITSDIGSVDFKSAIGATTMTVTKRID